MNSGLFPASCERLTMYKHLLVPIDGSELSERAAQTSLALAAKLGAKVTGFVAEPLPPLPTESARPAAYQHATEAHRERTESHAHQALDRFAAQAAEAGVEFKGEFKRTNSVDDAIVEAAAAFGCDLVVMVTHGRSSFGELLFGSHTKNVLTKSKLPLLVLH
jgi:nucleotide-binding universal stress UspA family protein